MDIFQTLEFSQEWIDLEIITPAKLEQLKAEWDTGDDTNTEHYRWRAFLNFMQSKPLLDADTAKALYHLGSKDPEVNMGGSMMAHILRRKDCPQDLLERATNAEEKFLRKIANERLAAKNDGQGAI
jgi:hypothetical protein